MSMIAWGLRPTVRRFGAGFVMAALLAGCGGVEPPPPPVTVAEKPVSAQKLVSRSVARAVWGVVPDAPRYKKDLDASMIRGSAVAVAQGTLLASCAVVEGRQRVGIVRHNKYYMADVVPVGLDGDACRLEAPTAPLQPIAAPPRRLDDLQTGEPIYALVNRSSADLDLTAGQVTGGKATGRPLTIRLPARVDGRGAVLFDARGSLVGFGVPPSQPGILASIVPMPSI